MKITFENGETIEITRRYDGSEALTIKIQDKEVHPGWLGVSVIVAALKEIEGVDK